MVLSLSLINNLNVQFASFMGLGNCRSNSVSSTTQRWMLLLEGHGLTTKHVPRIFPEFGVSIGDVADPTSIGQLLTDALLNRTSELFNVQRSYFEETECTAYEPELLDRDCESFRNLLARLQNDGGQVELLALRSDHREIEEDWHQAGALVLRTKIFEWESKTVYRYTPIFSLQDWSNPEQRRRAIKAMQIAHQFGCNFWGERVTTLQALSVAQGKVFPESVLKSQHPTTWHPDDYVVRPSVCAKGMGVVEQIIVPVR